MEPHTQAPDADVVHGKSTSRPLLRKWLNRFLQVGIIAFLIWQLTDVGWGEVLRNLPKNPLFYVIQVFIFLGLPVSELFIYRRAWPFKAMEGLPVFIYKKIYNSDVLSYSGEFYLYYWARKKYQIPKRLILEVIRDNNILSSVSSTMIAIALIGLFLAIGHLNLMDLISEESQIWLAWVLVMMLVLALVGWYFRKHLFSMSRKEAAAIFGIHTIRLIGVTFLQLLQWMVGMPQVAMRNWYSLLGAQVFFSRIPLIPNRDLLFAAFTIQFSKVFGIPQAELASMLLVSSVMSKVLNVVFFALVSFIPSMKPIDVQKDCEEEAADFKIDFSDER